jgi:hypothetical protein
MLILSLIIFPSYIYKNNSHNVSYLNFVISDDSCEKQYFSLSFQFTNKPKVSVFSVSARMPHKIPIEKDFNLSKRVQRRHL